MLIAHKPSTLITNYGMISNNRHKVYHIVYAPMLKTIQQPMTHSTPSELTRYHIVTIYHGILRYTKIYNYELTLLLLWRQTKSDDEHKMAKTSKYAEDDEILRVPIALAMVKLLQSLPKTTLQRNLPGWVTFRELLMTLLFKTYFYHFKRILW